MYRHTTLGACQTLHPGPLCCDALRAVRLCNPNVLTADGMHLYLTVQRHLRGELLANFSVLVLLSTANQSAPTATAGFEEGPPTGAHYLAVKQSIMAVGTSAATPSIGPCE